MLQSGVCTGQRISRSGDFGSLPWGAARREKLELTLACLEMSVRWLQGEFGQIPFHVYTKEEPRGIGGLKTFQTKALKLHIFHVLSPQSSPVHDQA